MIGNFVDGPMWYFSATVFVVGIIWRLLEVLRAGVARDLAPPRTSGLTGAVRTLFSRFVPRRTIAQNGRVQLIAGYMFHLGLFVLLFFAAPHVDFLEQRVTGFGWTPLPNWAFILASELAFAGLLLLILYRLMHPVTRLLSTADDYIGSVLIFVVMLTGCLALARSFEPLRLIHLLLVELLLLYFPFSSLMHAFTFSISRSYTGANMARKGVNA